MVSNEELLLLALLIKKKRRRVRKVRKQPMFINRLTEGLYYTLFDDLCADDSKFFDFLRMSKASFFELLGFIRKDIKGVDTHLNTCFPPEEKLFLTLRYLTTGLKQSDLQYEFRISQSSISVIIRQVCRAILKRVKPICFPEFSERFWLETATEFYEKTNFPHCIGALGGKHVRVMTPAASGSLYNNYKNCSSIVLLSVCDASYRFLFVDVGAYGKSADSTVFKESVFFEKLQNNMLKVPPPLASFRGMAASTPFVFVADEGFGLSTQVLRPYSGKCPTVKKKVFNYRLCRARRTIDCSFGILANKWRILHRPLNVNLPLCEDIIRVCCVLHNFILDRDGFQFEDTLTIEGLADLEHVYQAGSHQASRVREKFADYFVSEEGSVPWQMDRI